VATARLSAATSGRDPKRGSDRALAGRAVPARFAKPGYAAPPTGPRQATRSKAPRRFKGPYRWDGTRRTARRVRRAADGTRTRSTRADIGKSPASVVVLLASLGNPPDLDCRAWHLSRLRGTGNALLARKPKLLTRRTEPDITRPQWQPTSGTPTDNRGRRRTGAGVVELILRLLWSHSKPRVSNPPRRVDSDDVAVSASKTRISSSRRSVGPASKPRPAKRASRASPSATSLFASSRVQNWLPTGQSWQLCHSDQPIAMAKIYTDSPIVTAAGGSVPLSSSTRPSLMADMLQELDIRSGDRVLEIGTGTGYNAAIMAMLTRPKGAIQSYELDSKLAARARAKLGRAGTPAESVTVAYGDGFSADLSTQAFNKIIATVACGDVSSSWLRALSPGGSLLFPSIMLVYSPWWQ
jgi:protein-L-isoaspartate O-methyltransferase